MTNTWEPDKVVSRDTNPREYVIKTENGNCYLGIENIFEQK